MERMCLTEWEVRRIRFGHKEGGKDKLKYLSVLKICMGKNKK